MYRKERAFSPLLFFAPEGTRRGRPSRRMGKKVSGGERAERCRWQMKRGERVAAVDQIEGKRKPDDLIGHRNRTLFSAGGESIAGRPIP